MAVGGGEMRLGVKQEPSPGQGVQNETLSSPALTAPPGGGLHQLW